MWHKSLTGIAGIEYNIPSLIRSHQRVVATTPPHLEDHDDLRKEVLDNMFAAPRSSLKDALETVASSRNLTVMEFQDAKSATQHIGRGTVLLTSMTLEEAQWQRFKTFHNNDSKGKITTREVLGEATGGTKIQQSFIIVGYSSTRQAWQAKLSWGASFADNGLFWMSLNVPLTLLSVK